MDLSNVSLLPDEALAQAAQSGAPGIPSWLAMATLQKRKNLRASVPVAAPQGTVASDLVSSVLKSAGMGPAAPAPQQQPPQQQPASGGIAGGASVQSFSKGGIVQHFVKGSGSSPAFTGTSTGIVPQVPDNQSIQQGLTNEGWVAPAQTLTAQNVTYNPAMQIDTGDIGSAMKTVQGLYGQPANFEAERNNVAQNLQKNGTQDYGLGSYINTLVSNVLGNGPDAVAGFGKGLAAADATQRALKQQNFENTQKSQTQRDVINNQQSNWQHQIAQSALAYHNNNLQAADSQAREQADIAAGNAQRNLSAGEENARLASERARTIQSGMEAIGGDVNKAAMLKMAALQKGDKVTADYMDQVIGGINQRAKQAADLTWEFQKRGMDHQYAQQVAMEKMKEADADKRAGIGGTGMDLESSAQSLAHYTTSLQAFARTPWNIKNQLLARVKQINPEWNEQDYQTIQKTRNDFSPAGTSGKGIMQANTAISHFDTLGQVADAMHNGNTLLLNKMGNAYQEQMGTSAPSTFDGLKQAVGAEYQKYLKGTGQVTKAEEENFDHSMNNAKSPEQLHDLMDNYIRLLGEKMGKQKESIVQQLPGLPADDPLHDAAGLYPSSKAILVHHGFDPDSVDSGRILQNLPAGHGQRITPEVAAQFKAAADKAGKSQQDAMKYAKSFGWTW